MHVFYFLSTLSVSVFIWARMWLGQPSWQQAVQLLNCSPLSLVRNIHSQRRRFDVAFGSDLFCQTAKINVAYLHLRGLCFLIRMHTCTTKLTTLPQETGVRLQCVCCWYCNLQDITYCMCMWCCVMYIAWRISWLFDYTYTENTHTNEETYFSLVCFSDWNRFMDIFVILLSNYIIWES